MSKWISTETKLPPEGQYVIAKHCLGTWRDRTDQANVNTVIVKLEIGISFQDRELMRTGVLPDTRENIGYAVYKVLRSDLYKSADEGANNRKHYAWSGFSLTFFGQEITHWMPIPKFKQ